MGPYVDYRYYSETFHGDVIPENPFNKYAMEASRKINYYTFGKIDSKNVPVQVQYATCSIAELLYKQEELKNSIINQTNDNTKIASETLGPRSITYVNNNSEVNKQILSDKELKNKIYDMCTEYLVGTSLMYRGIYE